MPAESVVVRTNALSEGVDAQELYKLLTAVREDLTSFRAIFNAHIHSGITVGVANSAVSTTTVPAINTLP